jgi:hypothetical protein
MYKFPPDMQGNDLRIWAGRGAVVKYKNTLITFVSYDGDQVKYRTLNGMARHVDEGVFLDEAYLHWPKCGSLNLPDLKYAVYLRRQTRKRYERTYHPECLELSTPGKWGILSHLAGKVPMVTDKTDKRITKAAFDPEYPEWDLAMKRLEQGTWASVAISPHIILLGKGQCPTVLYRGVRIGQITDGTLHTTGRVPDSQLFSLLQGRVEIV